MRYRFVIVAVAAVLMVVGGFVLDAGSGGGATSRIKADPMPALFSAAQVSGTADDIAAQQAVADKLFARWTAAHGHTRDDKAFVAWLEKNFPAPAVKPASQMPVDQHLFETRGRAGVAAATWLELHGKKDIWKVYAHDEGEFLASSPRAALKANEKALLKLTKTVADALGTKFASPAPYVARPTLRPEKSISAGQTCPCSYPSRHAAAGAASTVLLSSVDPSRRDQYSAMQAQIDFSRVYMAGHYPIDVQAGALLGDVIGDYVVAAWT